MKKFLISLFLFLLPVLILLSVYVVRDPYKVLRHYDLYYEKTPEPGIVYQVVGVNRGHISIETFRNNYAARHYDSYIMGNSRSTTYHAAEWARHIPGGSIFHWDASGESLYGVERNLNYLQEHNMPIMNALVVIDPTSLEVTTNEPGHLKAKHYALTGQHYIEYQGVFLQDYFDPSFLAAYTWYTFTGKITGNDVLEDKSHTYRYDPATNEIDLFYWLDRQLADNENGYYEKSKGIFYERPATQQYHSRTIGPKQKALLQHMKQVFDVNHTNFRIVIGPAYSQKKLDSTDLAYMRQLFGAGRVFDFSGKNEITDNVHNYYEYSHYRPFISSRIMDLIYSPAADDSIRALFPH